MNVVFDSSTFAKRYIAGYEQAKAQLVADVADAVVLQLTPDVVATAFALLESHPLQAMDALHIAGALVWQYPNPPSTAI